MGIDEDIKDRMHIVNNVIYNLQYIPQGVDVKDLKQIGAIALWKAIDTYHPSKNKGSLKTYCYGLAKRDIIDYLRKLQAKKRKKPKKQVIYHENIEDKVMPKVLLNEIKDMLTDEEYEIFIDRHIKGLLYKEIASKYGLTERQVRYRLKKSSERMKDKIKWEGYGYD